MNYINNKGKITLFGYSKEIFEYVLNQQLLDNDLWALLVNQYRIKSDIEGGWRAEFWGKLMRGAATCYQVTKNAKLYKVLTNTMKEMITLSKEMGVLSTYPKEKELQNWDVWGRKYLMLGSLFYYDICKSDVLKRKVVKFVKLQADGLIKELKVRKISIFDTSNIYGSMNSCSILNSYIKLYNITKSERYLKFAKYIIDAGLCKNFNLIDASLDESIKVHEFRETKAYEMTSCMEGVLEYYKITKEQRLLDAVKSFVNKVIESDYSIIGCSGCKSEFFDNSSITQTNLLKDIAQETCVTVNFLSIVASLFSVEHDEKYISLIERSVFNALYGAVNNENQTMKNARGLVWLGDEPISVPHPSFAFDSYSPLYKCSRGKQVGGFMRMQDGKSFGCCTAIGAYGVGLANLITVTNEENSYFVNVYQKSVVKFSNELSFAIYSSVYEGKSAKVIVKGSGEFMVNFRIPSWSKTFKLLINNEPVKYKEENGYAVVNRLWNNDVVVIKLSSKVEPVLLNNKIAFIKGNIVLARDEKFNDFDNKLLFDRFTKKPKFVVNKVHNDLFKSNLTYEISVNNSIVRVCDYSQAGKLFDEVPNLVSVWQDYEIKQ